MKRLLIISCMALFGLLPIIPTGPIQAQSTSEAPYLYYYSDALNSFVIERADGSDARQFGQNLMDNAPANISGPGWSPSGEWFAWQAGHGSRYDRRYVPFALNIDGTQQLTGLGEYNSAVVDWSPIEDLLVVSGYVGTPQTDTETTLVTTTARIKLIDAATETVVFSHDISEYVVGSTANGTPMANLISPPSIYWMADGQHFIVQTTNLTFGVNGTIAAGGIEYVYNVFDQTGLLHDIKKYEAEVISESTGRDNRLYSGTIVYAPIVDPSTLVVVDLIADQIVEIGTQDLDVFSIVFSPDGNKALMMADSTSCESDCPVSVWLWQAAQTELSLVHEHAGWERLGASNVWSPDGAYAIVHTNEFVPILLHLDSGSVGPIEGVPAAVYWQWRGPNNVLLGTPGDEGTVYSVDVESNRVEHVLTRRTASPLYEIGKISPDGSLFAYVGQTPVIFDPLTGTEITVRPDGRSFLTSYGGEVYWSDDGEWILAAEDGVIAGGGAPRWTSIMRRDGSMRRELGQNGSPTIFGWLPNRVDVSQLPPAQSEPLFPAPFRTIHAPNWSFSLSWSPDGSQLVRGESFAESDSPQASTLFDVETGDAVDELERLQLGQQAVEWILNDDGSYAPQIVERPFGEWQDGGTIFGTSPDGSRVGVFEGNTISLVNNRTLSIYEAETNELLHSIDGLAIPTFSFRPDNSLLAVSSPYTNTQILDGETWEVVFSFNKHATAVAFSPDGQTLAIANSWDIELYAVDDLLAYAD